MIIMSKDFWNNLIESIENQQGIDIVVDSSKWNMLNPEYAKIYNIWTAANYNLKSIKWTNYYPGIHFDNSIVDSFAERLHIGIFRAWISRVDPGYYAAWHWDVDDNEDEYLKTGPIVRYSCFITPPTNGHLFILNNEYYFKQPQGTVLKWPSYRDWHSGSNAGLTPKYMFHIVGYNK